METDGDEPPFVITGLDPVIHLALKMQLPEDGYAGQARV